MASTSKRSSVRKTSTKSSSRLKSQVGGSSLARNKKPSLFSGRNGLIVAALAAIVGLVFVAFSQAAEINPRVAAYRKMPLYGTGAAVCRMDVPGWGLRTERYNTGEKYRCVNDPWGPSYWSQRPKGFVCFDDKVYKRKDLSANWVACRNKYR